MPPLQQRSGSFVGSGSVFAFGFAGTSISRPQDDVWSIVGFGQDLTEGIHLDGGIAFDQE